MKKILICIFAAAMLFSGNAASSNKVKVGSYNLRMQQMDKGDNAWAVRRARVMQSIRENDFDIFGVQEVTDFAQEDLRQDLGDTYDFVFFGPYSPDGIGTKAHGIIWRKDKFKLLECHKFWPSDTPDSCCFNDFWQHGDKLSKFKRGAMCCLFETAKGEKFIFMCSHAALSKEDNAKYAHVMIDREKLYNPNGYPSFFVGDLNTVPDSPSSVLWRTHWKDAALCVKGTPLNTFNSFRTDWDMAKDGRRIDFIYFRGNVKVKKYFCNTKLYDGFCASDHYPIGAVVKFK